MKTRVVTLPPEGFDPALLEEAAAALREGALVVAPTETVYGVAVNLDRPESVERLLEVRGSPADKVITVHVASREQALTYAAAKLPSVVRRLMRKFWPGPLTLVVPARSGGTVGLRLPRHAVTVELIRRSGVRVGMPSANRSGAEPATDGAMALREFDGKVDFLIDAGPCPLRKSSTVVRVLEKGGVEILREGAVPSGLIHEAAVKSILFVCTGNTCRSPMAEALLRSLLARKLNVSEARLEEKGFQIGSAGTAAGAGSPASEFAFDAVEELGASLEGHASRPVTVSMIEEADRVFAMTKSHLRTLSDWLPDSRDRIELLDPAGGEISDPIGQELEVYRQCARRIRACLEQRMEELL